VVGGDDWITVPTASRSLGLQLHTIYRLVENGELGGVDTYGVCMSRAATAVPIVPPHPQGR